MRPWLKCDWLTIVVPVCRENEKQCDTGECVHARRFCDGHIDCRDASDERKCGQYQQSSSVEELRNKASCVENQTTIQMIEEGT